MNSGDILMIIILCTPFLMLYFLIGLFVCISTFGIEFPMLCTFLWPIFVLISIVKYTYKTIKDTCIFLRNFYFKKETKHLDPLEYVTKKTGGDSE